MCNCKLLVVFILACLHVHTFAYSADVRYEIQNFDTSNEAGPHKPTYRAVCIARKTYWTGALSVTAPSRLTIPLGSGAIRFEATAGVDCKTAVDGAADFRVIAPDGKVLWEKKGIRKGTALDVHVDIAGLDSVVLEVSGEDGIQAGWAVANFTYEDGSYPPNDVRRYSPQLGILTPPERPEPRINGPVVYGVRPGHPIIYRVPVTGERPVKVKVESERLKVLSPKSEVLSPDAPHSQLLFDPETRVVIGSIKEPGEYPIAIVASNSKGEARKQLTIKVGEKISLTPAMGWCSWNAYARNVTAQNIKDAADALDATGLAEHGWGGYVNIDDYWQNNNSLPDEALHGPERNADGIVNPNSRFPDMKGLADYIHAKGFKAGLYSSPGPTTCGGCTGSYRHEEQDAKTYAEWGFDSLKHDWCSYASVADGEGLERGMKPYRIMGNALRAQNRDILFSLCQYGQFDVGVWGAKVGGQSWRIMGDVHDRWNLVSHAIDKLKKNWRYSEPGAWNDLDMLCVGKMFCNDYTGSRLAPNEQYTHLSMWALAASPLLISCDMTKFDEFTLSLLRNDEVIAIDQDPLGKAAACIVDKGGYEIWARPLADGSIAVGLFNKGLKESEIVFDMAAAGMEGKWEVRDCWRQIDEGVFSDVYKKCVYGHATHLIRFIPGNGNGERGTGNGKLTVRDIRDNAEGRETGQRAVAVAPKTTDCEWCDRKIYGRNSK